MKKACLVVSDYLTENKIFDSSLHRDDCNYRFTLLKENFQKEGYDLSTQDINSIENSEIIIYASNMPRILPLSEHIQKSYLILSESAFIRPDNYDMTKHDYFNKVFTWSDDLVDGVKYIKLNYTHRVPSQIKKSLSDKRKLCVLIAGNKKPKATLDPALLSLDLYNEREKAIRWFEKKHLEDFDLYGVGWDKYRFTGPKLVRAMNRIPMLPQLTQRIMGLSYPSYKGMVEHKKPIMEQYKFSICYENAKDIPGYITEKIFDSFFSGCVPIYWGANNIDDYVPKDCFIDRSIFKSYEELYCFISNMSESEYIGYLNAIERYLNSKEIDVFKNEFFSKTLLDNILNK